MCPYRDYVEAGGLMAYAVDLAELLRRMADDVHQILKGAKPGDIPIYQATKFELLIKDGKGAWPRHPAHSARPRRRGDRMIQCHSTRHLTAQVFPVCNGSCCNKSTIMARRVGLSPCEVSSFFKARKKTLFA
jgi:hypothetical protein